MLRGRQVFMEGLLLEKCMERGLTLPYRGGDVLMKSFIDSLSHACKVSLGALMRVPGILAVIYSLCFC